MMSTKSPMYTFLHVSTQGYSFVMITDTKEGAEVTKSIEAVILQICVSKRWKAEEHIWLYRDQADIVDGYDINDHGFVMIGADSFQTAINVFIARKERKRNAVAGPNYIHQ